MYVYTNMLMDKSLKLTWYDEIFKREKYLFNISKYLTRKRFISVIRN